MLTFSDTIILYLKRLISLIYFLTSDMWTFVSKMVSNVTTFSAYCDVKQNFKMVDRHVISTDACQCPVSRGKRRKVFVSPTFPPFINGRLCVRWNCAVNRKLHLFIFWVWRKATSKSRIRHSPLASWRGGHSSKCARQKHRAKRVAKMQREVEKWITAYLFMFALKI